MDLQTVPCPKCRRNVKIRTRFFPFCSQRCRLLDLGHWFDEDYRVSRPVGDFELEEEGELEEGGLRGASES